MDKSYELKDKLSEKTKQFIQSHILKKFNLNSINEIDDDLLMDEIFDYILYEYEIKLSALKEDKGIAIDENLLQAACDVITELSTIE